MKKATVFHAVTMFFIIALNINIFSQQNNFQTIGENDYVFMNSKWHLHDNLSGMFFPICDSILTLKFIAGTTQETINSFENQENLTFLRKSFANWYDYKITTVENIFEKYSDIDFYTYVDKIIIPVYGEYVVLPNDISFSQQWYLNQTTNADINAPEAWDLSTGSNEIIVAILDSGTDWTHIDIGIGNDNYQNIYLNSNENDWSNPNDPTTGNGIDDDLNGYIDDWKGYHFDFDNNDSRGSYFHGTHVAGEVAAKTNNNTGISGIAGGWNNEGIKMLETVLIYQIKNTIVNKYVHNIMTINRLVGIIIVSL